MRRDGVLLSMEQRSRPWDGKSSIVGYMPLDKSAVAETSRGKSENARNHNYIIIIDLDKHTGRESERERERERTMHYPRRNRAKVDSNAVSYGILGLETR